MGFLDRTRCRPFWFPNLFMFVSRSFLYQKSFQFRLLFGHFWLPKRCKKSSQKQGRCLNAFLTILDPICPPKWTPKSYKNRLLSVSRPQASPKVVPEGPRTSFWTVLGSFWRPLVPILGPFSVILEVLGSIWNPFRSKNKLLSVSMPPDFPKVVPEDFEPFLDHFGDPRFPFWTLLPSFWSPLDLNLTVFVPFWIVLGAGPKSPKNSKPNFGPQRNAQKRGGRRCVAVGVFDIHRPLALARSPAF